MRPKERGRSGATTGGIFSLPKSGLERSLECTIAAWQGYWSELKSKMESVQKRTRFGALECKYVREIPRDELNASEGFLFTVCRNV